MTYWLPLGNGCKGNKEHQQLWEMLHHIRNSANCMAFSVCLDISTTACDLLAAPWAMAARAMKSTSSSGRGKCSRSGVLHLEKRNAASTAMWISTTAAIRIANQNSTLQKQKRWKQ